MKSPINRFYVDSETDGVALIIDNDQALLRDALKMARQYPEPARLRIHLAAFVKGTLHKELRQAYRSPAYHEIDKYSYFVWLARHYLQKVAEGASVPN